MIKFLISVFFLIFTLSSHAALSGYYNSLSKFQIILDSQELPKLVNKQAIESITETKELTFLITYGEKGRCSLFATLDMKEPRANKNFVGGSIVYTLKKLSAPNCKEGLSESQDLNGKACKKHSLDKSVDNMTCERKDDGVSNKFKDSLQKIRRVIWDPNLADSVKQLPIESIRENEELSYIITYRAGDCALYVTLDKQAQKDKDAMPVYELNKAKIGSPSCS